MTADIKNRPELQGHIRDLELVIEEYTEWFTHVVRRVFFPVETSQGQFSAKPESFIDWMIVAEENRILVPETLSGLSTLHHDLSTLAEGLINQTIKFQKAPHYDEFDKLATFFEEFVRNIRRISKDYMVDDVGIDATTGLRNSDMFYKDIRREMDRLARQGKSFAVALVKIDDFETLKVGLTPSQLEDCLKDVAEIIKKGIRSFDDAYRLDEGQFLVSLKQTGVSGAMKALQRMRVIMDEKKSVFTIKNTKIPLSVSACIAEPLPEDDMRQLLANVKRDLDTYANEKGVVLEYTELSALQRLVKDSRV